MNRLLSGPQYTPSRDGTLEAYLEQYDGHSAMPLFKGYAHYELLWREGYLEPDWSCIRLMWNMGRGDEHFLVRGEYELEGLSNVPVHAGREGTYDPRQLLDDPECPLWEAQHLSHNPTPRNPK